MGNWSSQFDRALKARDQVKASELYRAKPQLREGLQPNQSLGVDHHENTYLHYAAVLGMEGMYNDLLQQNGKPDMKNAHRRNCLHLICLQSGEGTAEQMAAMDQRKCSMLESTIQTGLKQMDLKHLLAEKDKDGNTALHLAAGAGLKDCVQLLIRHEADLAAINEDEQTPADLAKAKEHHHIATSLEAKMVFSCEDDMARVVEPDTEYLEEIAEAPRAMQDTDLRSMKDALLIETSEMLGVGLQSAEALLKHYGWSKEDLLQAWLEDSSAVCASVGVDMPGDSTTQDFLSPATPPPEPRAEELPECGICCATCEHLQVPCGHHFCRDCWKEYLEGKIRAGDSQSISCPQYACYKLVPLEIIEGVVSQEMAVKFLSFDIKAFVDSNPNIRWCPHPGCSRAVGRPALTDDLSSPSHSGGEPRGQTVPCGSGHYFCWACLEEAHEPCSCAQWKRWLGHCTEMQSRVGDTTAAEASEAASSKWLVENSKPCPKCKAPIEKTEGCNHMCCKYCRHDFCWVCLEEWKCHNSSTGGYFNCNRYDAQKKAGNFLTQRRQDVLKDCKEWEEISKFLHYHDRYREHIKSYQLEQPFLDKAQEKMIELALSIQHLESGQSGTESSRHMSISKGRDGRLDLSFIQDAVEELLKCRQVLKATYCYGYYLTGIVSKKQFEHMQGALEQVTEMLAEAVARPHLRKPRMEIIRLTREGRAKRVALVKNVYSGLPLSTHPFMDSLEMFGREAHSWGKNNPNMRRFLQDLDSYTPRKRRSRHTHEPDTDDEFLRILEESRIEYEADRQMQNDLELAKTLSLRHAPDALALSSTPPPLSSPWADAHTTEACEEPSRPMVKARLPPLWQSPLYQTTPTSTTADKDSQARVQSPHWNEGQSGEAVQSLFGEPWQPTRGSLQLWSNKAGRPQEWSDEAWSNESSPSPQVDNEGFSQQWSNENGPSQQWSSGPSGYGAGASQWSNEAGLSQQSSNEVDLSQQWGPVFSEDEDLRIAIKDSLRQDPNHLVEDNEISSTQHRARPGAERPFLTGCGSGGVCHEYRHTEASCSDSMPQFSGAQLLPELHSPTMQPADSTVQFSPSFNSSAGPRYHSADEKLSLPQPLQHLLDSSKRTGTNV